MVRFNEAVVALMLPDPDLITVVSKATVPLSTNVEPEAELLVSVMGNAAKI